MTNHDQQSGGVSDEVLLRLLNIAADIIAAHDRIEQVSPPELETSGRSATPEWIARWDELGRPPELPPFGRALEDSQQPATDIENLVLDLMGVPPESKSFCRDWCDDQLFVAAEGRRRFKAALRRIRKAQAANWPGGTGEPSTFTQPTQ